MGATVQRERVRQNRIDSLKRCYDEITEHVLRDPSVRDLPTGSQYDHFRQICIDSGYFGRAPNLVPPPFGRLLRKWLDGLPPTGLEVLSIELSRHSYNERNAESYDASVIAEVQQRLDRDAIVKAAKPYGLGAETFKAHGTSGSVKAADESPRPFPTTLGAINVSDAERSAINVSDAERGAINVSDAERGAINVSDSFPLNGTFSGRIEATEGTMIANGPRTAEVADTVTNDAVVDAIRGGHGTLSEIATVCGVTTRAVDNAMKRLKRAKAVEFDAGAKRWNLTEGT